MNETWEASTLVEACSPGHLPLNGLQDYVETGIVLSFYSEARLL